MDSEAEAGVLDYPSLLLSGMGKFIHLLLRYAVSNSVCTCAENTALGKGTVHGVAA